MIAVSGYTVETLFSRCEKFSTYKAFRKSDSEPVLIKVLNLPLKNLADIPCLKHEFEVLGKLEPDFIFPPLALESYENGHALILKNKRAELLTYFIPEQGMELFLFLRLAIQLAELLASIHRQQVIHLKIRPSNILYDPDREKLYLIDFSSATLISAGQWEVTSSDWSKETLVYMSPEQTGRMNRVIDWRTDLYSLGVTYYQMLTGQLPFQADDPMEWAHSHIAKLAFPPHKYSPMIPEAVSDIVMMCLSKMAEDRYQSAYGLKKDLEECRDRLQESGKIEYFFPGCHDSSDRFQTPQKLYGREYEIAALKTAFERIAATGKNESILVTGYPGIGKSFLIAELQKSIVENRGYFIRGKFDPFQRYIPHESLIQAFRELGKQLLTESNEQLVIWKQMLLDELGTNGQVLIDVIPEMELILGKQPPLQPLSPEETHNRFRSVILQFMQVTAKAEHPLVIYLDDMQWADPASLKLVEMLITDSALHYLLLIGTFRGNEVFEPHPLIALIDTIKKANVGLTEFELGPFSEELVSLYCADTLHCKQETSAELAHLIFEKTHGNPFFVNQFLTALHKDHLLTFDPEKGHWRWDLRQIETRDITDNVIEFMSEKIRKLRSRTQALLQLAACIGSRFDFQILSLASEYDAALTAESLWEMVQEGLIISDLKFQISHLFDISTGKPANSFDSNKDLRFRFLHDRVQQAAYSLIGEEQRKAAHLRIGRLLLKNISAQEREEHLFDITNQMNIGREAIATFDESIVLASLNLAAGKKSKKSGSYDIALQYFTVGFEVLKKLFPQSALDEELPDELWETQYDLLSGLFGERAECEYLNSRFENAERFFEILLVHVKTPLEKASIFSVKTVLLTNLGRNRDAVRVGLQGLAILGINLPFKPSRARVVITLLHTIWRLRRWKIENLEHLPRVLDTRKLAVMNLIMDLYPPAYFTNQNLFALLILKIMLFTLKFGNAKDTSPYAYGAFAFLISAGYGRYRTGLRFAKLAIKISEQQNSGKRIGFSHFIFGSFINNWNQPASQANHHLLKSYHHFRESGALIYAGYAAVASVFNLTFMGTRLDEVFDQSGQFLKFVQTIKDQDSVKFLLVAQRYALALQGKTRDRTDFGDKQYDETDLQRLMQSSSHPVPLLWYYVMKVQVLYLCGEFQNAVSMAQAAQALIVDAMGLIFIPEHYCFYFLSLAADFPRVNKNQAGHHRVLMKKMLKKMENWSRLCPSNFNHRAALMKAEWLRLSGKTEEAIPNYLKAIQSASEHGFFNIVAIASERCADMCLKAGMNLAAAALLKEAYQAYLKWGVKTKCDQLEIHYHEYLDIRHEIINPGKNSDLATIIKAAQTIGSEILLPKLLKDMMQILIENAGANKGFLLLKQAGHWMIEAEGTLGKEKTIIVQPFALELINVSLSPLPLSVFHYVERTRQSLVLKDATRENTFAKDPYILKNKPKSLLCSPIIQQGKLIGMLYLENNLMDGAFTAERVELLGLLSSQAAISIENAGLYADQKAVNEHLQREINERREIEKELLLINEELERSNRVLKDTQSQLVQSAKLASIGELATGIAHELNQPLMYIRNSAQLFLMDGMEKLDRETTKETLLDIVKSTGNMMNIINHLRDFARHSDVKLEALELHEVLEDSLMLTNEQFRLQGIRLEKRYAEDLPLIMGNAHQLEQVFINILTNAKDAMEATKNACLVIKTSFLQLSEHHGEVTVAFTDNGEGIPEANLEKIFDPFFSTKEAGKGTGLGLSISYGIIRDHEGRIAVESNPKTGTVFRIILPVALRTDD